MGDVLHTSVFFDGLCDCCCGYFAMQVFEKDRDVLVAELRTSQLMNGHDAPDAGLLRDQIHTQVQSFSCDVIEDKLLIVA